MKEKKVVFTERNIHLEENERSVVMDVASKSLMEMYSYVVCQNKGNVLDVGFGMGYSANKMSSLSSTYTCIEINPQLYEKALAWAKDKPNVEIIFGDWYNVIPTLTKKFDGIFMDTHDDSNYLEFENLCKTIANEGCILSIFNYFMLRERSSMNFYDYTLEPSKFSKVVTPTHTVNWTYFQSGEFVKGKNSIKFDEPISLI